MMGFEKIGKIEKIERVGKLRNLSKYEIVEDVGVEIEIDVKGVKTVRAVRASLLALYRGNKLVCIQHTSPSATEPVKRFLLSYARVISSPFAVVAGDDVLVFESWSEREIEELPEPEEALKMVELVEERKFDRRIAVAYYDLIHCTGCERCGGIE